VYNSPTCCITDSVRLWSWTSKRLSLAKGMDFFGSILKILIKQKTYLRHVVDVIEARLFV
jgi:hypothetical protein